MSKEKLKRKAAKLAERYSEDISSEDLEQEMNRIRIVHIDNFGRKQLGTLALLNANSSHESIFPNLCVSLRVFLTAPATVTSAERSFSKLNPIKNDLRSLSGSLEQPG